MTSMLTLSEFDNSLGSCETIEQVNKLHERAEAVLRYTTLSNLKRRSMAREYRLAAQRRAVELSLYALARS
ncbi:MAG: hypothetical protein L0Y56_04775 [Nitrospira sp.]|nr:hypothetical protein [Nitrospira sp.]